jgi:hypothetical protein
MVNYLLPKKKASFDSPISLAAFLKDKRAGIKAPSGSGSSRKRNPFRNQRNLHRRFARTGPTDTERIDFPSKFRRYGIDIT